jgi:hypothetical protein
MRTLSFLTLFSWSVFSLGRPWPQPSAPLQTAEPAKNNVPDLTGTRWDGSIDWTEKGRVQGRPVVVPYRDKVTFRLSADGTCTNGKGQPCKWEQKGETVTISVERTKKACPGSASLNLAGDMMSGTWEHYGGFTCFRIPPPRNIRLTRHK